MNRSTILAISSKTPYPCEQVNYIEEARQANGTEPVDFLAEQQCLCHSNIWNAFRDCNDCYRVHGSTENVTEGSYDSYISSRSGAECTPKPPVQGFSNLRTIGIRTTTLQPLTDDKFPSQTKVGNYFSSKGNASPTPGSITGSATARQTVWTGAPATQNSPSTTAATTVTATGSAKASSIPTAVSSVAGGAGLEVAGGLALVIVNLAVMAVL